MQLLRTIGFFHGHIFLFSAIIGVGIFVSPKAVLQFSALNIPISLSIWAVCGLLSIMNALCLAEMGTTFPVSAASSYFLKRSLGSSVAFLSLWVKSFAYSLLLASISLSIASYLIQPFYTGCPVPELPKKCLALAILWSLGILNVQGVKTVSWFQTMSSLMKMAVLCFISLTGVVVLVIGKKENVARFENALDAELPDASQFAEALLQGLFAYVGSSVLISIAGEVKNPAETIPKSVISAMSIVGVVYLLTNISYLAVLTPQEIISSDSVVVTWMDRVFPSMQWLISLGISTSLLDTIACAILSGSRMLYSASQEGQLPFIYSMLNDHLCPVVAVMQIVILSSIVTIPSNLIYLLKYLSLISCIISVLNLIGLLKLRYQDPNLPRPYKVRLPFIFGSLACSMFPLVMTVILSPNAELIYQLIFLFSGFLCYWLQVHLNQYSAYFNTITCYLQLLFNVFPPEDQDKCFPAERTEN